MTQSQCQPPEFWFRLFRKYFDKTIILLITSKFPLSYIGLLSCPDFQLRLVSKLNYNHVMFPKALFCITQFVYMYI